MAELEGRTFDCMVLDLKLPGTTGFALLETVKKSERFRDLPVIVYTGTELTRRDETRLKKYAETVILKTVGSPERLLDETTLFLHRVEATLPAEQRRIIEELHTTDAVLQDKRVVVVELFTGAECPPCVSADVAFDALLETYKPNEVVLLEYHLHIPGPDPLTNADSGVHVSAAVGI